VKLSLLAVLVFSSLPTFAQVGVGSVVLQDVRLIDGTGHAPVDHVSILISKGKIAKISNGGSVTNERRNIHVLKLSGKTVMPGLIAGHAHLGLTKGTSSGPRNYTPDNVKGQLAQYERYGVTTVVSLGLNKDLLYGLRAAQEKGQFGGATILTADRGIGTPGGVPAVHVGSDQLYRPKNPDEARKAVQEMASRDPNLIKIWVDDNLHKLPEPNPTVYTAAINETHRQHLKVAAHVFYLDDAKQLVRDGVDILAHSIRDREVDADTLSAMHEKKVYYLPTLQLEESFFAYAEHPAWMDTPFFQNAVTSKVEKMLRRKDKSTPVHKAAFQMAMVNLKKVHDNGIAVGFGTDSGANPFRIAGWAEHRELQLMVQAGLTPLDAIHSATEVNAGMLQINEKTGTVTVGKQADLIVLDADPSADIKNTEKIAMIFHNGREVKR